MLYFPKTKPEPKPKLREPQRVMVSFCAFFQKLLDSMGKALDQTEELQKHFRRIEAHDRSLMEENFTRVNTWSAFQLVVMIAVGLLQVFMIRSLFDERSSLHRIWKR